MNPCESSTILHRVANSEQPVDSALISEEPLSIRIDGKPLTVIMRTTGEENAHAAGFCLAEESVNRLADI